MRPDRMTTTFQTALAEAQSLALGRDHQFIEPLHMMTVLLDQEDGSVQPLLLQAGVNVNLVRTRLGQVLDRVPRVEGIGGEVLIGRDLERVLNLMDKLAQSRKDRYVSSELFVLAALEDRGQLGEILRQAGADKSVMRPLQRAASLRYERETRWP